MNFNTNISGLQGVTRDLVNELIAKAKASERGRVNYNFHPTLEDNPHRFLNVMCRGTYFTPHRHLKPPKAESFLVLQGRVGFITFDDGGQVLETHLLSSDAITASENATLGIDIAPGIWHTLFVISDYAVCYEVKPGPYVMTNDKEFAPWAPHEGQPGTAEYQEKLRLLFEPS